MKQEERITNIENPLLTACVSYLREKEGFHELLSAIRDKHTSLGRMGGTVSILISSKEMRDSYESFFLKRFRVGEESRIPLFLFEKRLHESRYSELSVIEILEAYFGTSLVSRADIVQRTEETIQLGWTSIMERYGNTFVHEWLLFEQSERSPIYHEIRRSLQHESDMKDLYTTFDAMNQLPVFGNYVQRLPVFSSETTGDPHYFDEGTNHNRMMKQAIHFFMRKFSVIISESYSKAEFYYSVGILLEDMLNYTTIFGLRLWKDDATEHKGAYGFCQEKQPFHLTLRTIATIQTVSSAERVAYIVENAGVFSELVDRVNESLNQDSALPVIICTSGQLHLSSQLLIRMLIKQSYRIYYSGDFDPEGLEIAWKLKKNHPEHIRYWIYSLSDYEHALSDVAISSTSLTKLNKIQDEELSSVIAYMRSCRKAAYQELLIDRLFESIC